MPRHACSFGAPLAPAPCPACLSPACSATVAPPPPPPAPLPPSRSACRHLPWPCSRQAWMQSGAAPAPWPALSRGALRVGNSGSQSARQGRGQGPLGWARRAAPCPAGAPACPRAAGRHRASCRLRRRTLGHEWSDAVDVVAALSTAHIVACRCNAAPEGTSVSGGSGGGGGGGGGRRWTSGATQQAALPFQGAGGAPPVMNSSSWAMCAWQTPQSLGSPVSSSSESLDISSNLGRPQIAAAPPPRLGEQAAAGGGATGAANRCAYSCTDAVGS